MLHFINQVSNFGGKVVADLVNVVPRPVLFCHSILNVQSPYASALTHSPVLLGGVTSVCMLAGLYALFELAPPATTKTLGNVLVGSYALDACSQVAASYSPIAWPAVYPSRVLAGALLVQLPGALRYFCNVGLHRYYHAAVGVMLIREGSAADSCFYRNFCRVVGGTCLSVAAMPHSGVVRALVSAAGRLARVGARFASTFYDYTNAFVSTSARFVLSASRKLLRPIWPWVHKLYIWLSPFALPLALTIFGRTLDKVIQQTWQSPHSPPVLTWIPAVIRGHLCLTQVIVTAYPFLPLECTFAVADAYSRLLSSAVRTAANTVRFAGWFLVRQVLASVQYFLSVCSNVPPALLLCGSGAGAYAVFKVYDWLLRSPFYASLVPTCSNQTGRQTSDIFSVVAIALLTAQLGCICALADTRRVVLESVADASVRLSGAQYLHLKSLTVESFRGSAKLMMAVLGCLHLGQNHPTMASAVALLYVKGWFVENWLFWADVHRQIKSQVHDIHPRPGHGAYDRERGQYSQYPPRPRVESPSALFPDEIKVEEELSEPQWVHDVQRNFGVKLLRDLTFVECAICLADVEPAVELASGTKVGDVLRVLRALLPPVALLPCEHAFHRECLARLFTKTQTWALRCPLCRCSFTITSKSAALLFR
jgi:hypothetical protein